MNKSLPNKWIRKAIFQAINNIIVLDEDNSSNITVPCYNKRVPSSNDTNYYTIISTQTNLEDNITKCEESWQSSVLIDIVTIYNGTGNIGNSLLVDNITDAVRNATKNLVLDVNSNLIIQRQELASLNDLNSVTDTQNVFRNLLRYEFVIN